MSGLQVASVYAVNNGFLDTVAVTDIGTWESGMHTHMQEKEGHFLKRLKADGTTLLKQISSSHLKHTAHRRNNTHADKSNQRKIKSVGNIKRSPKQWRWFLLQNEKAIDQAPSRFVHFIQKLSIFSKIFHLIRLFNMNSLMHNGVDTELVVMIASNKGLCGSYNVNVYPANY